MKKEIKNSSEEREDAMKTLKNLLVVDDEKVVCDSCARILGERGLSVETSTDPSQALKLASEKEYAAILLDIKMPVVDGLEFLQELKKKHKDVRVIMITGYSTAENAAAAKRLGAADFIPKPFSPDELWRAVRKLIPETRTAEPAVAAEPVAPPVEYTKEFCFYDEAWMQKAPYNTVRIGAMLPSEETKAVTSVILPKVGDTVYRGLPLAAVAATGKPLHIIPSPVTGEVTEVNTALASAKPETWTKPCQEAWIAQVKPTALDEEVKTLTTRNVVYMTTQEKRVASHIELLTDLGCTVEVTSTPEGSANAIKTRRSKLFIIDATSFGEKGPEVVEYVASTFPDVKAVVIAARDSKLEAQYRANKILYYAMEPLAETELIDVLNSVYGVTMKPAPEIAPSRKLPNWISKISITNRHGKKVNLLSSGEILYSHKGVGLQLRDLIFGKSYPITFTLGAKNYNVIDIINEVENCDRMLLLEAKDAGKIPGSITVSPGSDALKGMSASEHKVKTLAVQPGSEESSTLVFDARSSRALAEFILKEMTTN